MDFSKPRRILVAVDFSEPCAAVLKAAKAYASFTGASLVMVHVLYLTDNLFGAGTFAFPDMAAQITAAAKKELQVLVAAAQAEGFACEGVVMNGIPDEEIRNFALDPVNEIDLIVVGTHGRTGIARVAFGSVAQRIVQRSPCPALLIPATRNG
jgi:nucleotide-binding universal stress UspA family protein